MQINKRLLSAPFMSTIFDTEQSLTVQSHLAKFAGALVIILALYPLYQVGTAQAETLQHGAWSNSKQINQNFGIKPTGHNQDIMLASMKQSQHWNHADYRGSFVQQPAISEIKTIPEKTKTVAANQDKHAQELQCLALNIYFEARGESEKGKRAVGHVVMNRLNHRKFPNSVCAVVQQGGAKRLYRCQFSWWCDGRSDMPNKNKAWQESVRIAHEIQQGDSTDPTDGALWYHAEYVSPYWRTAFQQGPKIGQHIFYLAAR